jgi:hypothetical protein
MTPIPPTDPGAGAPDADRPRVRVIRLAARGGGVALAAAIGFGLSHATPSQDDTAVVAIADDGGAPSQGTGDAPRA